MGTQASVKNQGDVAWARFHIRYQGSVPRDKARWYKNEKGQRTAIFPVNYNLEAGEQIRVSGHSTQPEYLIGDVTSRLVASIVWSAEGEIVETYAWTMSHTDWVAEADKEAAAFDAKYEQPGRYRQVVAMYHPQPVIEAALAYLASKARPDQVQTLAEYRRVFDPPATKNHDGFWAYAEYLVASEYAARALESLGK